MEVGVAYESKDDALVKFETMKMDNNLFDYFFNENEGFLSWVFCVNKPIVEALAVKIF